VALCYLPSAPPVYHTTQPPPYITSSLVYYSAITPSRLSTVYLSSRPWRSLRSSGRPTRGLDLPRGEILSERRFTTMAFSRVRSAVILYVHNLQILYVENTKSGEEG